jgi:CBS domain-containing protein
MTTQPEHCGPDTNLAAAVQLMWDADCGVLPVVDEARRVVGIITDRDICIALGTRNERASDIRVADVMQTPVHTCTVSDDVRIALDRMREQRVRRLPVLDGDGVLGGLFSLDDAALATADGNGVKPAQVLETFRAICAHRLPVPVPAEPALVG